MATATNPESGKGRHFGTNAKPSIKHVSKHEHGPGMSFWVGPTRPGTTTQGNSGPMKFPRVKHGGGRKSGVGETGGPPGAAI